MSTPAIGPTIVEAVVDRPAHGGESIALLDGRVILVRGAIPGERVRIELDDADAKLWRGRAVEILDASPHRIDPVCEAAAAGAGCCDLGFVDPVHAVELKRDVLLDALRRIGRFDADELPEPTVTALAPATGWRTRVRLGVDDNGRAGLRKRRSRDLVVGHDCAQNVAGLTDGLGEPGAVPAGGELHVVHDADGTRHVLHVIGSGRKRRVSRVEGSDTAVERVDGREFDVPVDGFWQAHSAAAGHYVSRIRELLPATPGGRAWDLYGGVGVLAIALADLVGPDGTVTSVESFARSAAVGRAALSDLPVDFRTGRVETVVAKLGHAVDLVVLDPPRTGAGAKTIDAIAAARPRKILHIGCDPATFARDARTWADNGYRIDALDVIDAFPGTHHLETISVLTPTS
ncbi:class I SAM-dependent RNA methyltransferase [Corynebacterium freneyi]|uniref:class I SAM-dependent RNA methyltransferase n=1 Tax=Corynebacterium freneyi TaxID=134034 RepID=UPI001EF21C71|nr:class I SAM-dependent RNA methyltransferase [Corynebacterium freneyi]MCG7438695.1 class I SAM-dependent RNA methyltransferase [Corynebacterium freneyi]